MLSPIFRGCARAQQTDIWVDAMSKPKFDQKIAAKLPAYLTAVLDCFPQVVALLDNGGRIVATNQAWLDFGRANGASPKKPWIGCDYLSVCRDSGGKWVMGAEEGAEGIRDVLAGEKELMETVYPCHGPDEKRWFCMRVRGFEAAGVRWVLIVHANITESKRASEALAARERHCRNLLEHALPGFITNRLDGTITFVNRALARMLEFDSPEDVKADGTFPRWRDPQRRAAFIAEVKQHGYVNNYEIDAITRTGKIIHTLVSATLHDAELTTMVIDITELKKK